MFKYLKFCWLILLAYSCTPKQNSGENDIRCYDISLAQINDTACIVHPFLIEGNLNVVIPSYWDRSSLIIQEKNNEWKPLSESSPLTIHQSQINTIFISTQSGSMASIDSSLDKSIKERGHIRAVSTEGQIFYDGLLNSIKGRGNTSWKRPKKPYNIQISKKTSLFNLKNGKKFCLLSHFGITAFLGMQLAEQFQTSSALTSCPVSLYLNGHYNGLYMLINKVEVAPSSVDITNLEKKNKKTTVTTISQSSEDSCRFVNNKISPKDISGGYLIEILNLKTKYPEAESGFISDEGNLIEIKSPEKATKDEVYYIRQLYNEFYAANKALDGYHPITHRYYADLINLESFARYYLLEELICNLDGGYGNVYLYKDCDSIDNHIYMGPVWDVGWAMGWDTKFAYNQCPESFFVRAGTNNERQRIFGYLFQHEDFRKIVRQLYFEELQPLLLQTFAKENLAQYYRMFDADITINHLRWQGTPIDESQLITDFMLQRMDYMQKILSDPGFEDYCHVTVNSGQWTRNLLYLVPQGTTFKLPDFSSFGKGKRPDGWYESDTKLTTDSLTIKANHYFEYRWK